MYNKLLRDLPTTASLLAVAPPVTMPPPLESLQTLQTETPSEDSNPWSESAPTPPLVVQPLHTPSPSALEDLESGGIKSDDDRTSELNSHAHADILDAFDPLAHHEEQSAREAWSNAEGHPPPIPPPKQEQEQPPSRESGSSTTSTSTSTSAFPSFSSFARSFALPSLPNMNMSLVAGTRARPQSLDTATLMPTPVHAATFAQQQDSQTSDRGSPKIDSATLPSHAVMSALRRENASRERAGAKDKDPPFDFQKFLDQMKTKGAEPVARYLRSCVLLCIYVRHRPHVFCHRFLSNFVRRTFTVSDQVKLINDFLNVGSSS